MGPLYTLLLVLQVDSTLSTYETREINYVLGSCAKSTTPNP